MLPNPLRSRDARLSVATANGHFGRTSVERSPNDSKKVRQKQFLPMYM